MLPFLPFARRFREFEIDDVRTLFQICLQSCCDIIYNNTNTVRMMDKWSGLFYRRFRYGISKRKLFDSTTRLTTTVLFGARSGLYNPYIQRKGKMEGFLYSRTPWTKSVSSHVRPNPARGTQFPRARGTHSLHPGRGREKAKKIERLRFDSRTVRFP